MTQKQLFLGLALSLVIFSAGCSDSGEVVVQTGVNQQPAATAASDTETATNPLLVLLNPNRTQTFRSVEPLLFQRSL